MSKLVWRKEKPDSAGVWLWRPEGQAFVQSVVVANLPYQEGPPREWCKLSDIPEIAEPVKYREPTIADVGKAIEVKRDGDWQWVTLAGYHGGASDGRKAWLSEAGAGMSYWYEARIIDDGTQAKPREWCNEYSKSVSGCFNSIIIADNHAACDRKRVIKVREVL